MLASLVRALVAGNAVELPVQHGDGADGSAASAAAASAGAASAMLSLSVMEALQRAFPKGVAAVLLVEAGAAFPRFTAHTQPASTAASVSSGSAAGGGSASPAPGAVRLRPTLDAPLPPPLSMLISVPTTAAGSDGGTAASVALPAAALLPLLLAVRGQTAATLRGAANATERWLAAASSLATMPTWAGPSAAAASAGATLRFLQAPASAVAGPGAVLVTVPLPPLVSVRVQVETPQPWEPDAARLGQQMDPVAAAIPCVRPSGVLHAAVRLPVEPLLLLADGEAGGDGTPMHRQLPAFSAAAHGRILSAAAAVAEATSAGYMSAVQAALASGAAL